MGKARPVADLTRLIDVSLPIRSDMLLYPGDRAPVLRLLSSVNGGDLLTVSEITIGCHVGTHIDAPAHFMANGATVDQLGGKHFAGPAVVLDLTNRNNITRSDVETFSLATGQHILLKTDNSILLGSNEFAGTYCHLTVEAAEFLLGFDPLSIGIDYYSLDPPSATEFPAHLAVARRGKPAFVCLDLRKVAPGNYFFFGFPLHIRGVEGCPIRAILAPSSAESGDTEER